jgi:hypothetical protein
LDYDYDGTGGGGGGVAYGFIGCIILKFLFFAKKVVGVG